MPAGGAGAAGRVVLIIDPDARRGSDIFAALRDLRAEAELVSSAEQGWRRFAEHRPGAVIAALGPRGRGGDWFLRRLRNEYLGAMPATYLLCGAGELAEAAALEPDGFLVPPVARAALAAIGGVQGAVAGAGNPVGAGIDAVTRLRELFDLSILDATPAAGLDQVVARVTLAFRATDCAAWATGPEGVWPRTARPVADQAARARLHQRLVVASGAAGTVLMAAPDAGGAAVTDGASQSLLALPLRAGGQMVGGLALMADGARLFTAAERDALMLLARRVAGELAWVTAHARLLAEHEQLREAALLDSLTGVWNRAAFEQAVATQIQAAGRSGQPLCLVLVDVVHLSAINDRHGHVVGDEVLAHLAGLLAANLRAQDAVGRIGGDELAVLLVNCNEASARAAVHHLRTALATSPFRRGDLLVQLSARFGVAGIQPDEDSAAPALARAEVAVRRARRSSTELGGVSTRQAGVALAQVGSGGAGVSGSRRNIPPGATLGGMYRVLHEISRGAMGVVYRGEDLGLGRPVALKVLRSDLGSDSALVERFRAEAALLASLHHPHLVQIYTFGTDADEVYFVMELVEGESVADLLARQEVLGQKAEVGAVAKVVDEIAGALEAMHAVGMVHRDVKPDNILIDRVHDRAVLVDVGVAKRLGGRREAAGTPGYAAPESFMDCDLVPATDVYGLAATAYAMLTGLPPFGSGELLPLVERQLGEQPAAPSLLRAGLSHEVDTVLWRALAPEPEDRYSSAAAFALSLGRALEQSTEVAAAAVITEPRAGASGARSRWAEDRQPTTGPLMLAPLPEPDDEQSRTQKYRIDGMGGDAPPGGAAAESAGAATPATGELGPTREVYECRTVFFRAAYQIFGHLRGTGWLMPLSRADPRLPPLVRPGVPPSSWVSADLLLALLHQVERLGMGGPELATMVGEGGLSGGWASLVTAVGRIESSALIDRADDLFGRYLRGGRLTVTHRGTGRAALALAPGPQSPVLCRVIDGWVSRLVELAGGSAVTIEHQHQPGQACRLSARWTPLALG